MKINHTYLASTELDRFFEDTEMSFGEILRAILREKHTGIKIENRSRLTEITDEQWCKILKNTLEDEQDDTAG